MSINNILKIMFISCICIYILAHVIIFIKSYIDYKKESNQFKIRLQMLKDLKDMFDRDSKNGGEDE